ncbi:methyltransferase, TIGR04325 family [Frigoriglobus tundricola]|nr:methyltransferase, TIGR04325 family [Frigoriglobus tundricola]
MSQSPKVRRVLPGLAFARSLARRVRLRYCRGAYGSFAAARAAIRPGRAVGYDNVESSNLYFDSHDSVKPTDYAVFYWLGPLLARHPAVFDFGGHVGRLYYPFQKYLAFPPGFQWLVCDLPAVVETGREVARQRQARHLAFTTNFRDADGLDIFFSSGTLQYVETDLAALLAALEKRPRHVLINRVPMSDRPTWFTVQYQGHAYCPYRIENRADFVTGLQRLGYDLVDSWRCYESSCRVLFRPGRRLRYYTGMYLRLRDEPRPMARSNDVIGGPGHGEPERPGPPSDGGTG